MNYTQQANEVLQSAKKMAKELKHPYIGTEQDVYKRQVLTKGGGEIRLLSDGRFVLPGTEILNEPLDNPYTV